MYEEGAAYSAVSNGASEDRMYEWRQHELAVLLRQKADAIGSSLRHLP